MATYTCSKCGLTGHSKNITCRHLFTSNQVSTIMTNIANVTTTKNDKGLRVVTFEFPFMDAKDRLEWDNDRLEMEGAKLIRGLTDEELEYWLCNHDWEHTGGEITVGMTR